MKKNILLALIAALLYNWGYTIYAANSKDKKKLIVLSKITINNYMFRDDELEESKEYQALLAANSNDSILLVNTFDLIFQYNDYGYLTRVNTTSKDSSPYLELKLNKEQRIEEAEEVKVIDHTNITTKTILSYKNDLLEETSIKNLDTSFVNDLKLNFEYNNKQLPSLIKVEHKKHNNTPNFSKLSYEYNTNGSLKSYTAQERTFTFKYDNAINPFAHISTFYTDPISNEYLFPLLYTNYKQKNNITHITNGDRKLLFEYTYNDDHLPIKAIIKEYYKNNTSNLSEYFQYEYYYKEIEITE